MEIYGNPWTPMGDPWTSMEIQTNPWHSFILLYTLDFSMSTEQPYRLTVILLKSSAYAKIAFGTKKKSSNKNQSITNKNCHKEEQGAKK